MKILRGKKIRRERRGEEERTRRRGRCVCIFSLTVLIYADFLSSHPYPCGSIVDGVGCIGWSLPESQSIAGLTYPKQHTPPFLFYLYPLHYLFPLFYIQEKIIIFAKIEREIFLSFYHPLSPVSCFFSFYFHLAQ